MKKLLTLFFVTIFMLPAGAQTSLTVAEDFSVKDINGQTHHLFEYLDQDKLVVIDFFTVDCSYCQLYADDINQTYLDFGCNNGNVIFLGMNYNASNQMVHEFDSTFGVTYPTVSGLQGNGDGVNQLYGILGYPTVIVIRPDRSIESKNIFPPAYETLRGIVEREGGVLQPCSVGIEPIQNGLTNLYPNPAQDQIALDFWMAQAGRYNWKVINHLGDVVREGVFSAETAGSHRYWVGLSRLADGAYVLLTETRGKREAHKFLIMN